MENLFNAKTARKVLILVGLVILGGLFTLQYLKLDYDFEQFFPKEDPQLDFYLEFREKFGTDNDFLLVALNPKKGIFNADFLDSLRTMEKELRETPRVLRTTSMLSLKIPVMGLLGPIQAPLVPNKEITPKDSLRIVNDPLLDQQFISKDRKTVALLINHKPFLSKAASDSLLFDVQDILNGQDFASYRMAGKVYGQNYYINTMVSELTFFASTSFLLLALFLFISFRSAWGVTLPMVVVVCTVILTLATITLLGYSISVLTTILPTILFVVGISDVVHLTEKYVEELRDGKSKVKAITEAFKKIGLATLLTSVTTCIGFLTLLTSSIMPIADFGWFAALGVFIAFLLAFSIFPAALLLLPRPKKIISAKLNSTFWKNILGKGFRFSLKRFPLLAGIFALAIAGSFYGINQIQINNFLLEDLSENDPHRQDFMFFEEQFGGVRPFEMAGNVTEGDLLDWENLQALEDMQQYLTDTYGANNLTSPLLAVYMANRANHSGLAEYYKLPETEKEYNQIKPLVTKALKHPMLKSLYSEEDETFRMMGNVVDLGGAIFRDKNAALQEEIATIEKRGISFQQTGMPMLIDKNNESLSVDMLLGLLIAFAAVGLIMGVLYRSLKMVLIALVPNIIPLLLIGGIMAALGIDLKLSTAIIFTIAFGIAVDDTIHFLARFRLEMAEGKSTLSALRHTYLGAGKAIVVTSIILFSGFITLIFSSFSSTYYLGLLVSITLLLAVITDLLLLPGLLYLAYRKKPKALSPS